MYNIINVNRIKVCKNSNICLISDHIPPIPIVDYSTFDMKNFYGYDSIDPILKDCMPHVDTLIFNFYQYIDIGNSYKKFYVETFFNNTVKQYHCINVNNLIDFSYKTKKFNYLSNKPRDARLITSCWLANNFKNYDDYNYTQSYEYKDFKDFLNELIFVESLPLESKILPKHWVTVDSSIEKEIDKDSGMVFSFNELNFYKIIKSEISPTVFSIVMEPVFWEHGCLISEKYINAVFGGTIPIINGYKVYDVIKEMGFDTFDDIIDTSAQFEKNSIYRILNLLEKNKDCLDNAHEIIKDKSIQERLIKNVNVLKNYNYNLCRARYSDDDVKFLIENFNKIKF